MASPRRELANPDYAGQPLTDLASVTPDTPLELLNLNWRERDLPERQRTKHVHRLHPYLGKFIPQLAEVFLRKYRPAVVCDPFVGCGTTLVEANALNIASVGCDIAPFNCLISKVKTGRYDLRVLECELREILSRTKAALGAEAPPTAPTPGAFLHICGSTCPSPFAELRACPERSEGAGSQSSPQGRESCRIPLPGERFTRRSLGKGGSARRAANKANRVRETTIMQNSARPIASAYLDTWFAPRALNQLRTYLSFIPQYGHCDVMKVILSRAARSARLTAHHDLDFPTKPQRGPYYCHKHSRQCSPTDDALQFLTRYTRDTLQRINEYAAIRTDAEVSIICGDSRTVPFPQHDMVLTSPPYVGLIDYHEQHRYAYELLPLLPEPFASVGWNGAHPQAGEALEIGAAAKGASNGAKHAYRAEIESALGNVERSLRSGGVLVVIVADRYGLYEGMAERLGLAPEGKVERHVNRRTGRRATDFFEQVLVWRKE